MTLVACWAQGSVHEEGGRSWKGEGGRAGGCRVCKRQLRGCTSGVFFLQSTYLGKVALETSGALPNSPQDHEIQCPVDCIFQNSTVSTFVSFSFLLPEKQHKHEIIFTEVSFYLHSPLRSPGLPHHQTAARPLLMPLLTIMPRGFPPGPHHPSHRPRLRLTHPGAGLCTEAGLTDTLQCCRRVCHLARLPLGSSWGSGITLLGLW